MIWFVVGVKYIASVSFGKDSLAMLLRLLEEKWPLDSVVFYNTGMEFDSIYKLRDLIVPLLSKHNVEFVELSPTEPFLYSMLHREVKERKGGIHYGYGWCGGTCRWGTSQKIHAIKKYKNSLNDSVVDYVGIAADEHNRFERAKREDKKLPLVEWGMTEKDCLSYCYKSGYNWHEKSANGTIDLYDILSRVSCWCCKNKNISELRAIYHYLPEYWDRFRKLQEQIQTPIKNSGSVFDLEQRFQLEDEWTSKGLNIKSKSFFNELKNMR